MAAPAIPRSDDPIGKGIDAIVALRPLAVRFIDTGVYGHPFAGWRAQVARLIVRLADEVSSSRLSTATGQALRDLCASEFNTVLPSDPTYAYGSVMLQRISGSKPAGVIPKGFRFRRPADPSNVYVSKKDAIYEATVNTVISQSTSLVEVPIRATNAGSFANTVLGPGALGHQLNDNDIVPVDALFDSNLSPIFGTAGGGSDGLDEAALKRAAKAFAVGQYAPILGSILAATIRAGAPRAAVFDDANNAITRILAVDAAWGTSQPWAAQVEQQIRDEACGFGCRVAAQAGANQFARVEATIVLRRADYLIDTSEVATAVGVAVRSYFDDRLDWYTWRTSTLQGVISRAHRKILTCSTVVVRDAATNNVLSEPTFSPVTYSGTQPLHVYLSSNAVQPTFLAPT